ncbi:calcium-activated potassium channel subunit alpha-1 isoform X2 [Hydra vulgaris]|uniref:calcium-activated potassium channel subunit alpha-1 isoform X2 n=1 Tax=Hydra vulgaris TaxID=6087 RepID=UPI001F5EB0DB|nr:calcium-activated potassium channel subunit alpha-1 isoform X1 [Hydra vulgaris]
MACNSTAVILPEQRKWMYYIGISFILYFGGIALILISKISKCFLVYVSKKNSVNWEGEEDEEEDKTVLKQNFYLEMVEAAGILVSAQNLQGRILSVVSFIFNLVSVAIYVYLSADLVEHCISYESALWKVEIALYVYFAFHLFIRFFAAHDKLIFWSTDVMTIIDILTMPTIFFRTILGNQYWIGLRFLRFIYLTKLSDILQLLDVFKTGSSFEMMGLIGTFLSVWLTSAGMVHLLENTGDWWSPINYQNRFPINYFECIYYLLVTMSTVGYGDISCSTYLGKIFAMMFIGVGLGLFASYLPAISSYISSHTKYNKEFVPIPGKKDFLHPDRNDNTTVVVFLAPSLPDVTIQTSLKKYETRTSYFVGTIYSSVDAERMQIKNADAVIILCNKKCTNPDEEDAANITRVIAVKNYQERVRCIVQIMMNHNKVHLLNCPQWNAEFGDAIICISELKLGFMAQSCNAPGFSTLIGNLFGTRSDKISESISETEQWKVAYMQGAANEIYLSYLSNSFVGMTFPKAVELCYEKLKLLLIAIELKTKKGNELAINPMDKKLKLNRNTRGFFIAQKALDAERALRYCSLCHKDLIDPENMVKCKCRKNRFVKIAETKIDFDALYLLETAPEDERKNARSLTDDYFPNGEKPKFDQTGTFYWCESRTFDSAKMTLEEAVIEKFSNHVVVLVLSNKNSPPLELRQLVLPLRASNNIPSMLKKVVILGDGDFLQREWTKLANFPDIHIVLGSPYNRQDLRAVNVQNADMCILLSPGNINLGNLEHEALSDREVISLTLNLKAMQFETNKPEKFVVFQSPLVSEANVLPESNSFTIGRSESPFPIKSIKEKLSSENGNKKLKMITELIYNTNAMFLDQDDMNIYDDEHFYLAQPYACGSIFTVSILDSLVSATYFNGDILTIVRNLVTGSVSSELDELLAEGKQPLGSFETLEIASARNRCRIAQVDLLEGQLSEFGQCGMFGDLFLYALRTYNMICLGLFRLRDTQRLRTKSSKRYVITFPEFNFMLAPTDHVFVLTQFQAGKRKKKNFSKEDLYI